MLYISNYCIIISNHSVIQLILVNLLFLKFYNRPVFTILAPSSTGTRTRTRTGNSRLFAAITGSQTKKSDSASSKKS